MCTKSAIHKDTDLQNLFGQSDQSVKTFGITWKKRPNWVSVVYDRIHRSSDDFSSEPIHSDKICTKSAIINPQNPQKPQNLQQCIQPTCPVGQKTGMCWE